MKTLNILILMTYSLFTNAYANTIDAEELAQQLNLSAGSKAIVQWERVFKSAKKQKRYQIDTLTSLQKEKLKRYLVEHAIDSDHPTIAGEQ